MRFLASQKESFLSEKDSVLTGSALFPDVTWAHVPCITDDVVGVVTTRLGHNGSHVSLFETGTATTISHNSADVFITGLFLENVTFPCLKRRYYYFHALISAVSVFFSPSRLRFLSTPSRHTAHSTLSLPCSLQNPSNRETC